MRSKANYTASDVNSPLFALIRAFESGSAFGVYSAENDIGANHAYGAYQMNSRSLTQVGAIDAGNINNWTGLYGDSLSEFKGNNLDQNQAAAHYVDYIAQFINRKGSDVIGGFFSDFYGDIIPVTETGFIAAAWENGVIASRMAHGQSFEQINTAFPNFSMKDYNDYLSRFEAGALAEGYDLPFATKLANERASQVHQFESVAGGSVPVEPMASNVTISPANPVVDENAGSQQFTLTRSGSLSQSETVYVSTTDGTTVSGESVNAGNFNPFIYQPVTFAAGSGTTQFGVTINDLGLYDGSVDNFGIKVSDAASKNANTLATALFSTINNDSEPVTTFQYEGNQFNQNPSYFPGTPAQNVTFQAGSIDADFSIAGLTDNFSGVVDKFKNDLSYTSGPYLTSIDAGVFGQQEQFKGVGQTGNAAEAILVFNNGTLDAADSQFAADFNGISISSNGNVYDFAFSSNFASGGVNYSNEGTFKKVSSLASA